MQKYQLVAIGGGLAGMAAAVRAAELGLTAVVLEKGSSDRYPCNTRLSGGIIHLAYNDVKRPAAELTDAVQRATAGRVSPDVAAALAGGGTVLVDWLARQGARFVRPGPAWQNWTLAPPRSLSAGIDWIGRGPDVILRQLGERLRRLGGSVMLGTRATGLRMDGNRCVGVEAASANGAIVLACDAVVLCDGGFQGDLELVRQHISPAPDRIKQRGAATACGDGLRMARAVGAAISELGAFYGHLLCRDAMQNDRVWPYPELDAVAAAGILVGADGRRFVDEGRGGLFMTNAVARLPDPLAATIVFDQAVWETAGRSARIPPNPHLARAGGTIHRAGTLAELAALAGLPADALASTVAAYNEAIGAGALPSLHPPRSADRHSAGAVATPPYYAIPVCAGITYSMGGVRIDADARVLTDAGTAIPGLYAAGSTTGGIEGGEDVAYLGGLLKAGVFGLRAAEHLARSARPG